MILLGIGANIPSTRFGSPRRTCEAALEAVADAGVRVVDRSSWYRSAPVPDSDQPWFVNGVAELETALGPEALLALLLGIEADLGRERGLAHGPRIIDLDLLSYGSVLRVSGPAPLLPHPRMHERAFVLRPLAELAPQWQHPIYRCSARELAEDLPPGQVAEALSENGEDVLAVMHAT